MQAASAPWMAEDSIGHTVMRRHAWVGGGRDLAAGRQPLDAQAAAIFRRHEAFSHGLLARTAQASAGTADRWPVVVPAFPARAAASVQPALAPELPAVARSAGAARVVAPAQGSPVDGAGLAVAAAAAAPLALPDVPLASRDEGVAAASGAATPDAAMRVAAADVAAAGMPGATVQRLADSGLPPPGPWAAATMRPVMRQAAGTAMPALRRSESGPAPLARAADEALADEAIAQPSPAPDARTVHRAVDATHPGVEAASMDVSDGASPIEGAALSGGASLVAEASPTGGASRPDGAPPSDGASFSQVAGTLARSALALRHASGPRWAARVAAAASASTSADAASPAIAQGATVPVMPASASLAAPGRTSYFTLRQRIARSMAGSDATASVAASSGTGGLYGPVRAGAMAGPSATPLPAGGARTATGTGLASTAAPAPQAAIAFAPAAHAVAMPHVSPPVRHNAASVGMDQSAAEHVPPLGIGIHAPALHVPALQRTADASFVDAASSAALPTVGATAMPVVAPATADALPIHRASAAQAPAAAEGGTHAARSDLDDASADEPGAAEPVATAASTLVAAGSRAEVAPPGGRPAGIATQGESAALAVPAVSPRGQAGATHVFLSASPSDPRHAQPGAHTALVHASPASSGAEMSRAPWPSPATSHHAVSYQGMASGHSSMPGTAPSKHASMTAFAIGPHAPAAISPLAPHGSVATVASPAGVLLRHAGSSPSARPDTSMSPLGQLALAAAGLRAGPHHLAPASHAIALSGLPARGTAAGSVAAMSPTTTAPATPVTTSTSVGLHEAAGDIERSSMPVSLVLAASPRGSAPSEEPTTTGASLARSPHASLSTTPTSPAQAVSPTAGSSTLPDAALPLLQRAAQPVAWLARSPAMQGEPASAGGPPPSTPASPTALPETAAGATAAVESPGSPRSVTAVATTSPAALVLARTTSPAAWHATPAAAPLARSPMAWPQGEDAHGATAPGHATPATTPHAVGPSEPTTSSAWPLAIGETTEPSPSPLHGHPTGPGADLTLMRSADGGRAGTGPVAGTLPLQRAHPAPSPVAAAARTIASPSSVHTQRATPATGTARSPAGPATDLPLLSPAPASARTGRPLDRAASPVPPKATQHLPAAGLAGDTPALAAPPEAGPPAAAAPSPGTDLDELVERAVQAMMFRLELERERRGYARWS